MPISKRADFISLCCLIEGDSEVFTVYFLAIVYHQSMDRTVHNFQKKLSA